MMSVTILVNIEKKSSINLIAKLKNNTTIKPIMPKTAIIILCSSAGYAFLLSIIISPENLSHIDKYTIFLVLMLFVIPIIATLILFFRLTSLPIYFEGIVIGLTVGSELFTVTFLTRLLFS